MRVAGIVTRSQFKKGKAKNTPNRCFPTMNHKYFPLFLKKKLKFLIFYTIILWLPELVIERTQVEGCANKLQNPV